MNFYFFHFFVGQMMSSQGCVSRPFKLEFTDLHINFIFTLSFGKTYMMIISTYICIRIYVYTYINILNVVRMNALRFVILCDVNIKVSLDLIKNSLRHLSRANEIKSK